MLYALAVWGAMSSPREQLTVFAAASLTSSLNEISRIFEARHPATQVQISFAGSQELATQINLGAEAHVFFSADRLQMETVIRSGKVDTGQVKMFADNQLALLVSRSGAKRIKTLKDLSSDKLKICLASDKVPVGAYTRQLLAKASKKYGADWLGKVNRNTVSLESKVTAVVARVEMDEVDAGIVYETDRMRAKKSFSRPIPSDFNVRTHYYVAIPKEFESLAGAKSFVALVLSKEGQQVLAKYGFAPPQ